MPTHPLLPPASPLLAGGSSQDILTYSSDFFIWNPFPRMLSPEVKALGSPQGLTVKGTHIPVPRGCQMEISLPLRPRELGVGGRTRLA